MLPSMQPDGKSGGCVRPLNSHMENRHSFAFTATPA
jgi:hypothetical protein